MTWAGARVFDSPATVADLRIEAERQPFIAVYCDEADTEGIGQPTLTSPMNCRLVIETGVASAIQTPIAEPGMGPATVTTVQLNDTTPALEVTIGFLAQQARDALLEDTALSPWADLWRELTGGIIHKVECVRGGPSPEQFKPPQRYASRIIVIHTSVLSSPVRGAQVIRGAFWDKFLTLADGDADLSDIATILRAHMNYPLGDQADYVLAQKYLGVTGAVVEMLGFTPYPGGPETGVTNDGP